MIGPRPPKDTPPADSGKAAGAGKSGASGPMGAVAGVYTTFQELSLRRRVGVLSATGVGLLVVLISLASFVTVRAALLQQTDSNLLTRASQAVNTFENPGALLTLRSEVQVAGDVKIGMIASDGEVSWANGAADKPILERPELRVARGLQPDSVRTIHNAADNQDYRVAAVPVPPGELPFGQEEPTLALVLAQSTENTNNILQLLALVLFIVGGVGIALAAWAGYAIARTGLRPVERLTGAAEHIARTGDLRPISVQGNDELARLGQAFNAMLSALAASRGRERRLVADAGHELRTPLTSLRTNLDLLAQSEHRPGLTAEDRKALMEDVRAQVSELSDLVGDLVELSRDDPPAAARLPLELAEVTSQAIERVKRRAPNVTFDAVLESWPVIGDPQSLERAVTNLLDNAAKWSPTDGVITVRLLGGVLTVADQGPGISDVDLPHVFDRFYRSAEARTMPGSGLGLAIVKQAADRHGGTVEAFRSSTGGALFVLRLPAAPRSS